MSLMDQLTNAVMGQIAQQGAKQTGLDAGLVEKLLPMAMGTMMGGMQKNARQSGGLDALSGALSRHDGSVLDNLSNLGNADVQKDGQNILRHMLGNKQNQTQAALAKSAGIDQGQMGQLMAMMAPALMGALGKSQRQQDMNSQGLGNYIQQQTAQVQQQAPKEMGGLMGFIDKDGDGDFKDDLMEMAGKKLLGGLFGRK